MTFLSSKKATAEIPSLVVITILALLVIFIVVPFFQKGSSDQYGTLREISKDVKAGFDKLTGKEEEVRKTQADGDFLTKYTSFVTSFQSCFSSSKKDCICRIPFHSYGDERYSFELKQDPGLGYYLTPYRIEQGAQYLLQKRRPLASDTTLKKKSLCYITPNAVNPQIDESYPLASFVITQSQSIRKPEDIPEVYYTLIYSDKEKPLTANNHNFYALQFYKPTADQMCFMDSSTLRKYINSKPLCDTSTSTP